VEPRSSLAAVIERIRRLGRSFAGVVQDTPRWLEAKRTERALRAQLDANLRAIGKRVVALQRRSRVPGRGPFDRYGTIAKKLERHRNLEADYLANKARLGTLAAEIRGRTAATSMLQAEHRTGPEQRRTSKQRDG
jgi:hypothetical protein